MKNMKVCALLCAVALSANTALPVMAAENAENTQATEVMTEVEETQPVEEQKDAVTENETESDSAEQQEEVAEPEQQEEVAEPEQQESEPEAVQDETKQEETQAVQSENNAEADAQGQAEVKEDGWYTDEDGNYYYYENGEMITDAIVEIEDEDGTYAYYFDSDGIMYESGQTRISYWDDENKIWISGTICADSNGHLYRGWKDDTYYGEDYFQYCDKILEQDGASYYFNEYGYLVVNQAVVIDGVLYQADENGVLTVKDTASKTGWEQAGEKWYYYKDGEALSNTFEVINGVQYHFGDDGTMDTGKFEVEDFAYLAELNGQVVKAKGWYHSSQTKKWYWFDEKGELVCNALVKVNGTSYYFEWNGEMQTGVFWADYYDEENDEWVNKKLYADASGAISTSAGWKIENGDWYYVKKDGTGVSNEIVEINGKKYSFDWEGKMRTGKIDYWEDGELKYIFTDNSGAIVTNNWVQDHLEWYHTDENGYILKNQWINDTFYVDKNGAMAIGATQINGKTYIFDENGYLEVILENMEDGWHLEDGDWYYIEDGEVVKGWKAIQKTKYYFDEDGKMVTDGLVPAEHLADRYSYVDQDGHIKSGWAQGWNDWLYFEKDEETGDIVDFENGWKKINGIYYYFEDGYMVANDILEIDGKLSKFDASGAWVGYATSGWQRIGSEWYYINADGTLNTERTKTINGVTYYFSPYGLMSHNMSYYDESTRSYYWINGNGNLDTSNGWKKTPWNEWFYVENGKLVSGTKKVINGVEYTFYEGGHMMAGQIWYDSDAEKYFLYDENGKKIDVSKDGWYNIKEEGKTIWYYFKNGRPYEGKLGNYYISDGKMITGVYGSSNAMYLFDENGTMQKNGWKLYQGVWYYAGSSGRLYTGERKINGKTYWFDKYSGDWIR